MTSWRDDLNEDIKDSAVLAKYDSAEAAHRALIEATSFMGNSIRIPSEDAGPEDHKTFIEKLMGRVPNLMMKPDFDTEGGADDYHKMIGVPDDEEGYKPKEGFKGLTDELVAELRTVAAKIKMPKRMFDAWLDEYVQASVGQEEAATAAVTEHEAALKKTWGAATPELKSVVEKLVGEFQDEKEPLGELNNAAYKLLYNISKALSGEGPQAGKQNESQRGADVVTPAEAKERLVELRNKPAYLNRDGKASPEERKLLLAKIAKFTELAIDTE